MYLFTKMLADNEGVCYPRRHCVPLKFPLP